MSIHEHLIVTDKYGRTPDFFHDFHCLVALGTKVLRRWEGTVWYSESTSRVNHSWPSVEPLCAFQRAAVTKNTNQQRPTALATGTPARSFRCASQLWWVRPARVTA